MPYYGRRSYAPKPSYGRRAPAPSYRRKTYVPKPVKRYVQKAIDRDIENKLSVTEFNSGAQKVIDDTDSITIPYINFLCPVIFQGTTLGTRLGNRVKLMKCQYRFTLNRSSTTGAGSPPQIVSLVIGRLRNSTDSPVLADCNMLKIADTTAGGAPTLTGINSNDMSSLQLPFNKDVWDIKFFKRWKMYNASNSTTSAYNNNDFNLSEQMTIDVTRWLKKRLHYNNAVNNLPENEGLYAMWYVNSIDDSATLANAITVSSVLEAHYQDA